MYCNACGATITTADRACPNCGTRTSVYYVETGTSPYDPTIVLAHDPQTDKVATEPPSAPGSQTSSMPYIVNPYEEASPYPYTKVTPPPPPFDTSEPAQHTQQKKRSGGWIVGAILLLLVILGSVVMGLRLLSPTAQKSGSPLPSQQTNPQQLYNQVTSGTPIMKSPLTGQDAYNWDQSNFAGSSCSFKGGTYHATAQPGYDGSCYAEDTDFSNFALQARMTVINGHSGGILFRANTTTHKEYEFYISTDGTYHLDRSDSSGNNISLASGSSLAILNGANQPNLIAVLVQGNNIFLYVNNHFIDRASDNSYQSGNIGVYALGEANATETTFSKVQVWSL